MAKRGDIVLYTLPNKNVRTAIVLAVESMTTEVLASGNSTTSGLTLAVLKQKPDDFSLPPNSQSSPDVRLGHELGSAVVIVGNVAQGGADRPGTWFAESPAPQPVAEPAPAHE